VATPWRFDASVPQFQESIVLRNNLLTRGPVPQVSCCRFDDPLSRGAAGSLLAYGGSSTVRESTMKRKADFLLQQVGGQDLLVPLGSQVIDTNGIVILNATGRFVWEMLVEDRDVAELAAALAERFDVDLALARADVQTFLDEIGRLGLVE
jgi:hypothetical protein